MKKTVLISEMLKFHFGSKIFCDDGQEGVLAQVIFDPETRRLTHIGVRQGRLFGKIAHLPFTTVTNATGDGVTLSVKRAAVTAAQGKEVSGAFLDSKTTIVRSGGSGQGSLLLAAAQPESGELAYIVAHNIRPGQNTLLRAAYVSKLATDQIAVSIPDEVLKTLPPYRSDSELQQEVESILFDLTPMHIDLKGMKLRVLDSVLYMDGNISSSLRGDIAQDQVLGVLGLMEIKNNLVADDQLAADIARALGQDPRTRDLPIGVYPRLGTVRLSGAVHSGQQKSAAADIAQGFPGVQGVMNDLLVEPGATMLHVMSEPEGGEAEDKVPGKYIRHTK